MEPVFSGAGRPGALKICVVSDEDYFPWTPAPYLQDYSWEHSAGEYYQLYEKALANKTALI